VEAWPTIGTLMVIQLPVLRTQVSFEVGAQCISCIPVARPAVDGSSNPYRGSEHGASIVSPRGQAMRIWAVAGLDFRKPASIARPDAPSF